MFPFTFRGMTLFGSTIRLRCYFYLTKYFAVGYLRSHAKIGYSISFIPGNLVALNPLTKPQLT